MRYFFCLTLLVCSWSDIHSQDRLEIAILEYDGITALNLIPSQGDQLHELTLLTEAWTLYGNDQKEQRHAERAFKKAASSPIQVQKYYEARWLQSQYKFSAATALYLEIDFNELSQFQQHILLNALIENSADSSIIANRMSILMEGSEQSHPHTKMLEGATQSHAANSTKARSILDPFIQHSNPHVRLKAQLEIGRAYVNGQQYDEALAILAQGLSLAKSIQSKKSIVDFCYLSALASARSGNFQNAIPFTKTGAFLAQEIGSEYWEYRLNSIRAWSYFGTNEDFNNSLSLEKRQFELVNKFDDDLMTAGVFNNLGYDLTIAGTVPLDSAIELMTITNDIYAKSENSHGRWYSLMNLVWQTRLKGDFSASVEYAKKSVIEGRKANDRHALIEALFQLGESLFALGKTEEARKYYEEANVLGGDEEDRDRYVNDVYYAKFLWETGGNKSEAIKLLENAVNFLQTSEVFYEMKGRAQLAKYYLEQKELSKARAQISILNNPRNNYISFETRTVAAIAEARIMHQDGDRDMAKSLLQSYFHQARQIGARALLAQINNALNEID